jgi:sugar phosphate isomerase/epimerase
VSFEPHVQSITESPEDALKVVEQVPHLKLTLDYSHFLYLGYTDDQIEPLLPHTGHFHVRQARQGVLQCGASEGEINFERALSRLCELGYDGWVAFEYVWEQWLDNDRVDVLSETLVLKQQLAKFFGEDA